VWIGALWTLLYARRLESALRICGAALSFAGAVPYVAFALVVRALVCSPVAMLAAGQWLALRPEDQLAYRSLLGAAPGLLAASAAGGLGLRARDRGRRRPPPAARADVAAPSRPDRAGRRRSPRRPRSARPRHRERARPRPKAGAAVGPRSFGRREEHPAPGVERAAP